jgi:hypothetical protein
VLVNELHYLTVRLSNVVLVLSWVNIGARMHIFEWEARLGTAHNGSKETTICLDREPVVVFGNNAFITHSSIYQILYLSQSYLRF